MTARRPRGAMSRRLLVPALPAVALVATLAAMMPLPGATDGIASASPLAVPGTCSAGWMASATEPPAYYAIELVPTRRVPGARDATGVGNVSFARSPFGIAVAPTGEYVYDVALQLQRLSSTPRGVYTAWITTAALDQIKRLGPLDVSGAIRGQTTWNKFLVVVTLEPDDEPRPRWSGPIVTRGMSRSGRMHTMAGHGPFQLEPCTTYGY